MSPPPTADRPVHPPTRPLPEWASPRPARPEPARPRRLLRGLPGVGTSGRASLPAADRDGLPEWGPDRHPHSPPTLSTLHSPLPTNRPVSRPYRVARLDSGTSFAAGELLHPSREPVRQQPPATWPVEGRPRWPRTRQV